MTIPRDYKIETELKLFTFLSNEPWRIPKPWNIFSADWDGETLRVIATRQVRICPDGTIIVSRAV